MVAVNPETGEREHGTVTSETRRIFENLKLLLESAESSLNRIVQVHAMIYDRIEYDVLNRAPAGFSRTCAAGTHSDEGGRSRAGSRSMLRRDRCGGTRPAHWEKTQDSIVPRKPEGSEQGQSDRFPGLFSGRAISVFVSGMSAVNQKQGTGGGRGGGKGNTAGDPGPVGASCSNGHGIVARQESVKVNVL